MYCPNCGKADQIPDSYCRSCGAFLVDPSHNSSLMNRVFGIRDPGKQVKFTLTIDLITAIVSGLLLFFMMGYFDATRYQTGQPTPTIVYFVYVFLGLVSVWQLLSFTVGTALQRKLNASRVAPKPVDEGSQQALPAADDHDAVATSITEQTTKNLERIPRR
jgi:hypothetical protein